VLPPFPFQGWGGVSDLALAPAVIGQESTCSGLPLARSRSYGCPVRGLDPFETEAMVASARASRVIDTRSGQEPDEDPVLVVESV
jgi:hypothetical protein